MKKINLILTIVFGLLITIQTNAQGLLDGFTPKKGDLSVTASYTSSNFEKFYAGNTKLDAVPAHKEIKQNIYSIYAKYGLTDKLSLVASVPYIIAKGQGAPDPVNNTTEQKDFQDISIALKFKALTIDLEKGNLDFIAAVGADIPAGYEPNGILSLGSGAFSTNLSAGLHVMTDSGIFTTFMNTYHIRGKADNNLGVNGGGEFDVPNAYSFSGKLGYASSIIYIEGWLDYLNSTDGVDIGGPGFAGNFPETKVEYARVGATIYKDIIPSIGVSVSYGKVIDGRNLGNAENFSVGLTYKLNN